MAYSAGDNLDQNFASGGFLERDILKGDWRISLLENCGFVSLGERRHIGDHCLRCVFDGYWEVGNTVHEEGEAIGRVSIELNELGRNSVSI
jgi:hypothetical protein